MNSRQRVMKALNHEEPDMVPVDMGSTENTTLTRIAYINLRRHLGMPEERYNRMLWIGKMKERILRCPPTTMRQRKEYAHGEITG